MKKDTTHCSRCKAVISPDEVEQGLAIQILGHLLCSNCIDAVAPESGAKSKQQKQLPTQVYCFPHPQFAQLNRYTFISTAHTVVHRRTIRDNHVYDVPMFTDMQKAGTQLNISTEPIIANINAREQAAKRIPLGLVAGIGIGCIALVSILIAALGNEQKASEPTVTTTTDKSEPTVAEPQLAIQPRLRSDFAKEPLVALSAAKIQLEPLSPLLSDIRIEARDYIEDVCDQAQAAIDSEKLEQAQALLDALQPLPDDPALSGQRARYAKTNKELEVAHAERLAAQKALSNLKRHNLSSRPHEALAELKQRLPEQYTQHPVFPVILEELTELYQEELKNTESLLLTDKWNTVDFSLFAKMPIELTDLHGKLTSLQEQHTARQKEHEETLAKEKEQEAEEAKKIAAANAQDDRYVFSTDTLLRKDMPDNLMTKKGGYLSVTKNVSIGRKCSGLPAGNYHVWIQIRKIPEQDASLQLSLGTDNTLSFAVPEKKPIKATWYKLSTQPITISQPVEIKLSLHKAGWNVYRIFLGNKITGYKAGEVGKLRDATKLQDTDWGERWAMLPKAPPPFVLQHNTLKTNKRVKTIDYFDDKYSDLQGLPLSAGPTLAISQQNRKTKKQQISIDINGANISNGGCALLLHNFDSRRSEITVTITDTNGTSISDTIPFTQTKWTTHIFSNPTLSSGSDEDEETAFLSNSLATLTLSDTSEGISSIFFLASVALANEQEPQTSMLGMKPSPLLPVKYKRTLQHIRSKDIQTVVNSVFNQRKKKVKRSAPEQVAFCVGETLHKTSDWSSALRTGIRGILTPGTDIPEQMIFSLKNDHRNLASDIATIVRKEKPQFIVLFPGWTDMMDELDSQKAVNVWLDIVNTCRSSGSYPIIALGPDKFTNPQRLFLKDLVTGLQALKAVPIIDVRSITSKNNRFPTNGAQESVDIICRGYREIIQRLGYQRLKKRK